MQYATALLLALSAVQNVAALSMNPRTVYSGKHNNKVVARAPVFQPTTWNDINIAGGQAGKAKEEALAKFAALPTDLAQVDPADITFLKAVNQICNDAERGAYNKEIAGSQPGEAVLALQRGKIKNKVMKLTATVLSLQAQIAQGASNVTAKLAQEQKKLDNNIAQDQKEAGQPATQLKFDATTADPEKNNVAKDDALAQKALDVVRQSGGVA